MVNFYKTICNLSYEQRKEIGNIGRQWALKTFDVKVLLAQFLKNGWIVEKE